MDAEHAGRPRPVRPLIPWILALSLMVLILLTASPIDRQALWPAWVVALAACSLLALLSPPTAFIPLAVAASFLDYQTILDFRISVGDTPINLLDLVVLSLLPSFWVDVCRGWLTRRSRHSSLTLPIIILVALFAIAAIRGFVEGNSGYFVARDARSLVFMLVAYYIARHTIVTAERWNWLISLLTFGGLYGVVRPLFYRMPAFETATDYLQLKSLGAGTAPQEFALLLPLACVCYGRSFLRSRSLTYFCAILSILGYLASFSLTMYALLLLIPLLTLSLARLPLRRFLFLLIGILLVMSISFTLVVTTGIGSGGQAWVADLGRLTAGVTEQLLKGTASDHAQGRVLSWQAALDELHGADLLWGLGVGWRGFVDTRIANLGVVAVGEPTYATYLLQMGLAGVLGLLLLQVQFVRVCYRALRRAAVTIYLRATVLAVTVYSILCVINCILHNNFLFPLMGIVYGLLMGAIDSFPARMTQSAPGRYQLGGAQRRWHTAPVIAEMRGRAV